MKTNHTHIVVFFCMKKKRNIIIISILFVLCSGRKTSKERSKFSLVVFRSEMKKNRKIISGIYFRL
jgi:hypothetical protein